MRILQISTADSGGGAEGTAWDLHNYFRAQGQDALLAVGRKYRQEPEILEFPRPLANALPARALQGLGNACRRSEQRWRPARRLARICERLADPLRFQEWWQGSEEFHYPGTQMLLTKLNPPADIIHCHNLHGYYFNLQYLPELSRRLPVVLNLHDAWPLTGHCAYPLTCERWQNGCGDCPYLDTYPACRRDNTRANWQRKAEIYRQSRLYVTAPSEWILAMGQQSMLAAKQYRLIPNGIDGRVFCPGEREQSRQVLRLPIDSKIVLFVAAANSIFKDPETLLRAIKLVAETHPTTIFLCLGRAFPRREYAGLDFRCLPFIASPALLAEYYRAADVFVHTSKADTFGKTITEAMACGTPVVATDIGGIPEQMIHGQTGFLAPLQDAEAMAKYICYVLAAPSEQSQRFAAAAAHQGARYDLAVQGQALLAWYQEIQQDFAATGGS